MKHSIIAICMLSVAAISCNNNDTKKDATATPGDTSIATSTTAADKKEPAPRAVLDSATKMKNWQAYSTPGEVHKMLAGENGTWTGDMTMWEPGKPPQSTKITTINKMILGGRYQVSTNTGNMMGMPFEGISTIAYDNARKTFINTWIDNMGTGMMVMEGTWDDATKTINFKGNMVDPEMGDGSTKPIRQTYQSIDSHTQLMAMYCSGPDGKEMKIMEIKYTRK